MSKPRIMIENDSRHALTYRFEYPVQVEEYQTAVDELIGTPIDILSFQLGYGNGFLHGTNVADRWGPTAKATESFRPGGGTQWTHSVFQRAYTNAKQLIEEGEKSIYTRILKDINLRDKTDINRKVSPLVIPKGAILIDNSSTFKNTISQINKALKKI